MHVFKNVKLSLLFQTNTLLWIAKSSVALHVSILMHVYASTTTPSFVMVCFMVVGFIAYESINIITRKADGRKNRLMYPKLKLSCTPEITRFFLLLSTTISLEFWDIPVHLGILHLKLTLFIKIRTRGIPG